MPSLPSGRRIEFSLDRFHALLSRLEPCAARDIARQLHDPEDLLTVMDAVYFHPDDAAPHFAGYLAADWPAVAADWPSADRQALQAWFASPHARAAHAEAIAYIRALWLDEADQCIPYPYLVQDRICHAGTQEVSRLRQ